MTWLPLQSCHVTDAAIQSNAASAATSFFGGPRCVPLLTLVEARRIAVTARRSPTLPCTPRAVVPPQDGVCGAALSRHSQVGPEDETDFALRKILVDVSARAMPSSREPSPARAEKRPREERDRRDRGEDRKSSKDHDRRRERSRDRGDRRRSRYVALLSVVVQLQCRSHTARSP